MIKVYDGILSRDDCDYLTRCIDQDFDSFEENEMLSYVGKCRGYYDYAPCNEYAKRLNEIVQKDYNQGYEFSHNFTRVYYGQTVLTPHIDRPGLDLTLSMCIYDDLHEPWPLVISHDPYDQLEWGPSQDDDFLFQAQFRKNATNYYMKPGGGVAYKREYVHWREPIDLKGRNLIQVFYHWKKI